MWPKKALEQHCMYLAAPRDAVTNKEIVGSQAMEGAKNEYGSEGATQLLQWRRHEHALLSVAPIFLFLNAGFAVCVPSCRKAVWFHLIRFVIRVT